MTTLELARIALCSADEAPHETMESRSVSSSLSNPGHCSTRARLDADDDGLNTARGIIAGLLIGAVMWVGIMLIVLAVL